MKNKSEKTNKCLILLCIIIAIAIIVGAILYCNSNKNDSKISVKEQILNHTSTEDMKEQAPLINMNNTENAKIQNGEKLNSSEKLKEDKILPGLKITNIKLHTESGLSNFYATVENTTEEEVKGGIVNLIFKKSDGSTLTNMEAMIPTIKANGSVTINASTTEDIANAYDVEIAFK